MQPVLFYLPFGPPLYGYGAMLCLSVTRIRRRSGNARQMPAVTSASCNNVTRENVGLAEQSVVQLHRCTESGEAPGWQGATTENIGNI